MAGPAELTEILTSAQMRAIEAAAIESGKVTGLDLMERAGAGVVEAVFAEWPQLATGRHRAVVLCGPGNNGGDGFVVARRLHALGWSVDCLFRGDRARMSPDAGANHDLWARLGPIHALDQALTVIEAADLPALIIDALFGTGMSQPLHKSVESVLDDIRVWWWRRAQAGLPKLVAVDFPSGLHPDTGLSMGATPALLTVTFERAKTGHYLQDGPRLCGALRVVPLGLNPGPDRTRVRLITAPSAAALAKKQGHKFSHGHALVLAGVSGRGGAARLAARGALRIGAGLVTLGCPPDAIPENAARFDAVMLAPLTDAAGLAEVLRDDRITALGLGPGLGVDRAAALLPVALASRAGRAPCAVLDADALTALARDPALFALVHERCVLTPHAGEFARLFPDLAEKLASPFAKGRTISKVDATREAAKRAGCVVLYKGADSVIARPDGQCSLHSAQHDRAAPWLATAGSGDVLAGFITGLLARGFAPMKATETATWLHVECARAFGPGLIAEDLPETLPAVLRGLAP